ncbi:uncharacterized protein F4807DRAFT_239946 [Annulohypoxylon truncatum]|uniref:uncharacterized protein n=1 Tax=Annulohypoxylon truncatum TaxID=327061 RepID=UPI002007E6B1|nr:uncharacterized protein F4807DRAFT_239946 [Annulohypoxylon truncatum]KAI1206175.1 hypothetical protein F4807DRAFT_239946 [Annulohypoxylon truncatum]
MNQPVPTPRQFLTSLINSLTSIPIPPTTTPSTTAIPSAGASNPLKLIPPAHRPLLTTLYTLYPLTLLPALDLLDRRLATRVIVSASPHQPETGAGKDPAQPPSSSPSPPGSDKETPPPPTFYIVRSAQPQHPRRGESSTSTSSSAGLSYVVRLSAWNCTCAAFAFAAFPREERGPYPHPHPHPHSYLASPSPSSLSPSPYPSSGPTGDGGWEFGALSADGVEGSGIAGVPCCKHLLACVLAERWGALLGGYVDERVVGREEGAGLVADI